MNRTTLSLSVIAFVVAAGIAVIVATSGSSTSKALAAPGANRAISVKQTSVGPALTDANGRALYLFAADKPNVSKLSAAGRAVWPPFNSSTRPAATGGAKASDIGAVTGMRAQVTYHGHPLYYFAGDNGPGQVAGQGLNEFGGRWYVLSSAGGAITTAPPASAGSSGSTGSSSGYSY